MWLFAFVVALALVAFVAARVVARHTRERALALPLPDDALALLERRVPLYRALPAALKPRLHRAIREFLHDKRFVGCDGLEVTDDMRLVIAAQACLLVCAREPARYAGFTSVLVYPDAFVVNLVEHDGDVEIVSEETRAGESWAGGPVILSWRDVEHGLAVPDDGYNVVLHEFAHKLDDENEIGEGLPLLRDPAQLESWAQVLSREFAALRATAPAAPTVVDFDNAIYEADGLVRDGKPREAEALLARFAPVHVEMGKRFYPNGVRWATLLALARARQGRHAEAQAALARIRDLPAQFPVPAEQLLDYRIDVARVLRAAGRRGEAQRVLFAGGAGIGEPPPHFSPDYVDLALTAFDLALDDGDAAAARGHLSLADEHFRRHGRPGAFPGIEAEVAAARKRLEGPAGR